MGLWNDPKYSFGVKDTDLNGQSVSISSTKANSKGDIEIASFIVNVVPYCKIYRKERWQSLMNLCVTVVATAADAKELEVTTEAFAYVASLCQLRYSAFRCVTTPMFLLSDVRQPISFYQAIWFLNANFLTRLLSVP